MVRHKAWDEIPLEELSSKITRRIVTGDKVIRGQDKAPGLMSNPLVWAAIAAAIAVPIAVHNLSDSGPST